MQLVDVAFPGGSLPLLRSAQLSPFAHGFSTRAGGVSAPPYDSLNFGRSWGDDRSNVLENRRRLVAACGGQRLFLLKQVHGRAVARVDADTTPEAMAVTEADALVTKAPGAVIAVFSADCVALLFADPVTGAVGAAHAGWRGVVGGMAPATIAALAAHHGARPADLRVALGPAIGPCCFEVGPEVVDAFVAADPASRADVSVGPRGKPHIDLKSVLRRQLIAAGVAAAHIDVGSECTKCDPANRFYSYRRDNTRTGQHLAAIAPRATEDRTG